MTLRAKKAAATRAEMRHVYENMNLPGRNITVEHDGVIYVREFWYSLNSFGWGKWVVAA